MTESNLRDLAQEQIASAWSPSSHNLQTASSHTDYFGSNLAEYTEALSNINIDWAITEFENWRNSLHPSGFAPHYLSKPHPRGIGPLKMDASWIDQRVLHTTELPNGEHVSNKAAPPNWAIAAKTIADKIKEDSSQHEAAKFVEEYFSLLCDSSLALYRARPSKIGLMWQNHKDELTLRDGFLADRLKSQGGVNDLYIQALLYKNDFSLRSIADEYKLAIPDELAGLMASPFYPEFISSRDRLDSGMIENWLGLLTVANQFEMLPSQEINTLVDSASMLIFKGGVPTYIHNPTRFGRAVNETDKGSVNHSLSIQLGKLLVGISQKEHLDVLLRYKALEIGFTIIEKSADIVTRDGFVRQSDPNDSTPRTARTGLGQKIGRSQPVWTPTAVAIYNALPELSK